jgi:preprotein translocase subunit SecD
MLKKLLILLVLAVVVIGAALLYANRAWLLRPNFHRVGGTELVYAVDAAGEPFAMDDLCQALSRRIDPTGSAGVLVVPNDEDEVAIRIPNGKDHDPLVEAVPILVHQQGRLEFLVVANRVDDGPAFDAARDVFKKEKDNLVRRQKANEAPPVPRDEKGNTSFAVALKDEPEHTYRWAEAGKNYLWSQTWNSDALEKEENAGQKKQIDDAIRTGEPFVANDNLYHVRAITNWERRSKRDRDLGKTREFFVLMREPEKGKEVTGDLLASVKESTDQRGMPCVDFTFGKEGGARFFDLTSRNKPAGGEAGFRRHLAIVFDGQVMSAPALLSPIRERGQITGNFTQTEIQDMVRILAAGALPVRLKPDPVAVRILEPSR